MINSKIFLKGLFSIKSFDSPGIALGASFIAIGALLKNIEFTIQESVFSSLLIYALPGSLVLAESMLNFTPCISTDVGDASIILSDVGEIIPIGDYKALAYALIEKNRILRDEKEAYFKNCVTGFEKTFQRYDIQDVSKYYIDVWKCLV